ncbi:unnamed protein product [Clonostachys byssicola]|uniref:Uncharacterized protein n=1 Tax=Clonostachys byssicola TaxID=160290 RepID=A0A9N9UNK8_9HYPO|nr:unnamed protein product [Clonostachys byssicola]
MSVRSALYGTRYTCVPPKEPGKLLLDHQYCLRSAHLALDALAYTWGTLLEKPFAVVAAVAAAVAVVAVVAAAAVVVVVVVVVVIVVCSSPGIPWGANPNGHGGSLRRR